MKVLYEKDTNKPNKDVSIAKTLTECQILVTLKRFSLKDFLSESIEIENNWGCGNILAFL